MNEDGESHPKTEAELLERIASLYVQLESVRGQRSMEAEEEGPRVILVTRRLPRDAWEEEKSRLDAMDQALANFRQVYASGREVIWIGRPEKDVKAEETSKETNGQSLKYVPVFVEAQRERMFYSGFCKRVLWPLFHSSPPTTRDVVSRTRPPPVQGRCSPYAGEADDLNLGFPPESSDDAQQLWNAYVSVNRAYADVVHDVARDGDMIWIQDYHFMLLPQMLRAADAEMKLGFFLHVPFPSSELYRMLPYREQILHGLLAADLVGFQTYDYARHFLSSCEIVLGIETSPDKVEHDGHQTRVCVCPVGIEPSVVRSRISTNATRLAVARLENQLQGRTLILSVDTLDPTKGLVHKFLALEELFNEHPELADQIVVVQVALGAQSSRIEPADQALLSGDDADFDDDDDDDDHFDHHLRGGEMRRRRRIDDDFPSQLKNNNNENNK